ncbi:MAG: serine hydrolase domain-containing protein [Candidatus Woesearchaeota archaeon]
MKRKYKVFLTILVLIIILFSVLAIWMINSPWSVMFTLFADGHRADNFKNMNSIFPYEQIYKGSEDLDFRYNKIDLPEIYFFEDEELILNDFLNRTETTSLIVLQNDTILFEEYYQNYSQTDKITSWSVAKSFVSAMTGILYEEGLINNLDDPVKKYVKEYKGTPYGNVTIRNLLTMSSGIKFNEDYEDFTSDINMIFPMSMGLNKSMLKYTKELDFFTEQGTYNNYISSDTLVLGYVLEEVSNKTLPKLLEEKIWQPLGMESDAYWSTERNNKAIGFCCLNAISRDYARFGFMYLNDGLDIVPENWIHESINRNESRLQPGDNPQSDWTFGYGYKWWIPENSHGDYTAIGVWGQYIYIDPLNNFIIVKTSTDYYFDENDYETIEVFRTIVDDFKD